MKCYKIPKFASLWQHFFYWRLAVHQHQMLNVTIL
jgi:hypothetical protein